MNITTLAGSRRPHQRQPVRRVLIIHGYAATPRAHWFPWLRDELHSASIEATVLPLPSPGAPRANEWEAAVGTVLGTPDETTWIVAHSLGAITTLRVLHDLPGAWTLGGLVMVSGFTGRLESLPMLDDYLARDIDAKRISGRIQERWMLRSDDDLFVPPARSDDLAARLGARVRVQRAAGHFLADDGVTALPVLRELLSLSKSRALRS